MLLPAPSPRAVVVLLTGGTGFLRIADDGSIDPADGFAVRSRQIWAEHGIAAIVPSPPNGDRLLGQRHGEAYAAALAVVAGFAREQTHVPVWLIGASQGAIAAANGAARFGGEVAGAVLMSAITKPSGSGETVFDSDLAAIRVPVLVVANAADRCRASPPGEGPAVIAAMTASPRRELLRVESDQMDGDACGAPSPHSFSGIEASTIARIADWIGAAPR